MPVLQKKHFTMIKGLKTVKIKLTTNELVRANDLSNELIAKLEQIKARWAGIPSVENLEEIRVQVTAIAGSLNEARETYNAKDFPGDPEDFSELVKQLGFVVSNLNEVRETGNAADFPVAEEFHELDKTLGSIAGSLNEIIENQSEVAEQQR